MEKKGFSHESQNAVSVDWYTPEWIFKENMNSFGKIVKL